MYFRLFGLENVNNYKDSNMIINKNNIILVVMLSIGLNAIAINKKANFNVIPRPSTIEISEQEVFVLDATTYITYPENNLSLKSDAEFLQEYIDKSVGLYIEVSPTESVNAEERAIHLCVDSSITNPEGYEICISKEYIRLAGGSSKGVFYAIQTLRKSLPHKVNKGSADLVDISTLRNASLRKIRKDIAVDIPVGKVSDAPRFPYRAMHLDVCRHFYDSEFVKKYIDILALHGINTLHWHITDDQGWRIEIKKYPLLTEIGSVRNRTVVGRYDSGEYDNTRYGGFYTQEEAKEIVEYAARQHITIIPEVDLPGHMLAALAAYPNLGCTGGPYEVCPDWGIFPDVLCLGNPDVYTFLKDVFTEICDIFPGEYIHIGGDEAPRDRWKLCPKCQNKIKEVGLSNDSLHSAEDRLQTYCMSQIADFLKTKNRTVIGWDEILDGDVIPDAVVMSWRGFETAVKAAERGNKIIMVPTSYCYFDYYQSLDTENEPLSIGGYVPIEKIYSLNPIPEGLSDDQANLIIGCQANIWTEYIEDEDHLLYMVLPRMAALSEVQWMMPEDKDFNDFASRIPTMTDIYDSYGYNYSKHIYDIKASFTPNLEKKGIDVALSTPDNAQIACFIDDAAVELNSSLTITSSCNFKAVALRKNGQSSSLHKEFRFNKATMRPIEVDTTRLDSKYTYGGVVTLVDGIYGHENYATGEWLGFIGGDIELNIDLGSKQKISRVGINTMVDIGAWIMGVKNYKLEISEDGKNYSEVKLNFEIPQNLNVHKGIVTYRAKYKSVNARYVKLIISPYDSLPVEHPGKGNKPYLFIDEISIE